MLHILYTGRLTMRTKRETDGEKRAIIIGQKRVDTQTHTHKNPHTSGEEGADHEAEVDSGHGEDEQEDKDQRGVAVGQHCSVGAHLKRAS